ncbi:MAG: class I SAM-dependent methyltransferase [Anaerolineales bacterium]
MANSDALRWNKRYLTDGNRYLHHPRSLLLRAAPYLPPHGFALDVACGLGTNAKFMLKKGFRVLGVDISYIALSKAKHLLPNLDAVCADMENFDFPNQSFDVILNFYYLQRSLWYCFDKWLKGNGLVIMETLTIEMKQIKPEINDAFLLYPGELRAAFSNYEIIYYQEGWIGEKTLHPRCVASLIARKVHQS